MYTHTPFRSRQALVQLPSVSIAKATMQHFAQDEAARIGNKKVYINFSRSRSIEGRDIEPLNSTSSNSRSNNNSNNNGNNSSSSNSYGGGGGITNASSNGLAAARTGAGSDGNGHVVRRGVDWGSHMPPPPPLVHEQHMTFPRTVPGA